MKHSLYLAWRYLAFHRVKTTILVASITLIVYLPLGLQVLVGESAEELTSRAGATPLLVGAKGSPLELVLNSLYFDSRSPERLRFWEVKRIAESGLAEPIPLHIQFRARKQPIVGTTLDYFDFRGLRLARGRPMAVLGECVLGARVAEKLAIEPGGSVVSSPESVFDLAGVYPLKMRVAGVLEAAYTPDDEAIFVDVKTAWVIAGLGHGHQDLSKAEAAPAVLSRKAGTVVANASLREYREIDTANLDSFHFHGDVEGYPITAVLALPRDAKSAVILRGRYQSSDDPLQIVEPLSVMQDLLATILRVQSTIVAAFLLLGLSTVATAALVFLLSLRLRRREIQTIQKIGGSPGALTTVLASEVVLVLVLSVFLGALLTGLTSWLGSAAIRNFLLS